MPGSSDTAGPSSQGATRAALIVAAWEFEDPKFARLRSPGHDAEALAEVLADPAIGEFAVRTVLNRPGETVQEEIERFFAGRAGDDVLLLYFSCHGIKDINGRLHFVTTTTKFDVLHATGVSAAFVREQMELSRSRRIVLLLDCCYSGAFVKGLRARGDDAVAVGELEGRGRAVITASRATEYAFEADELTTNNAQPSIFTTAVIEGLSTGQADRDGDGLVTVDELYDFVYTEVRRTVSGQTPGHWVDVEGKLVVARNPRRNRELDLPGELRQAIRSEIVLQRVGAVWQLLQWLDHDDLPINRHLVTNALAQLSRDSDQRVSDAARAALARHSIAVREDSPSRLETARPSRDAGRRPAPEEPAPTEPGAPTLSSQAAGWLALFGSMASSLGMILPFGDGDAGRLIDSRDLYWLWGVSTTALVVYASLCLLRLHGGPIGASVVLLAVAPTILNDSLVVLDTFDGQGHDTLGPGFVLVEVGHLCVLAATAVVATMSIESLLLLPSRLWLTWSVRCAAVLSAVAVAAWGELFDMGAGGVWLAIGILVGWLVVSVAPRVSRDLPSVGGRTRRTTAVLVGLGLLALSQVAYGRPGSAAYLAWATGAAAVPVVANVMVRRQSGAALLVIWAASSLLWASTEIVDGAGGIASWVLAAALAAAAYLAYTLTRPPNPPSATRVGVVGGATLLAALVTFSVWLEDQVDPDGPPGEQVRIEIVAGQSTSDVGSTLQDMGVISSARVWSWYAFLKGDRDIQAGVYEIPTNLSMSAVLDALAAEPLPPGTKTFTVPEGQTVLQMQARLTESNMKVEGFTPEGFAAALADPAVRSKYLRTEQPVEGTFFPDTYDLVKDATEKTALAKMRDEFDATMDDLGVSAGAEAMGRTPYEILVIASIIEEEARVDEDRAKIARVIYNRLDQDIALYIDAINCYDLNPEPCVPSKVDFEADSPYNSRKVKGLPPTPISAPGRASLEAALHPAGGDWLYYVLDPELPEGQHFFTASNDEFLAAKARCRDAGLGCG